MLTDAFQHLLSIHAGPATARQLALLDFLGPRGWHLDVHSGHCAFGTDLRYPIQLLGTESQADGSWLWAWANSASQLPDALLTSARRLRDLGVARDIAELRNAQFDLDEQGHALAAVASGLIGDCCYYRGPYEGGAVYFLVFGLPAELFAPVPMPRAINLLMQAVSAFAVNGRQLTRSFLQAQGFTISATDEGIEARRGADTLVAQFDELDRLIDVHGTLPGTAQGAGAATAVPAPPASALPIQESSRRWWQFWKRRTTGSLAVGNLEDWNARPESLVRSFQADYLAWNDAAFSREDKSGRQVMDWAKQAYGELLRKYCRPGFSGQPIAFGSTSAHHPEHERIVSIKAIGTAGARVRTQIDDSVVPGSSFLVDYEYVLGFSDGRWFLHAVDYLDADGRYPGL